MPKQKGLIHLYTGDGKGKTTAALGLALRAIGAGKSVAIIQFMKKGIYSEHQAIKKYRLPILIEAYGLGYYKIMGDKKPKGAHQKAAQKALQRVRDLIASKKYDLIILDEINVAIGFGLIDINEVIEVLTTGNQQPTLVLTGRRAHPQLKKIANLITEMKKIKHYFDFGQKARKGIEY
jgi:cob(I)alamin adenosyltransferase